MYVHVFLSIVKEETVANVGSLNIEQQFLQKRNLSRGPFFVPSTKLPHGHKRDP